MLTVVGGKVVHGAGPFAGLAPELPAPMPDWSPVTRFGGYHGGTLAQARAALGGACAVHGHDHAAYHHAPVMDFGGFWGALGCSCFAF